METASCNPTAGRPATPAGVKCCSDPLVNPKATYPNCPDVDFQFHHQAFNYWATYAPGTAARKAHLKDEAEFTQLANSSTKTKCNLKQVSFIKPVGEENEHPGYASESIGSGDHLVALIKSVEGSACAKDTLFFVTYDEFGGQWDHVPAPGQGGTAGPHDAWGPGTRIPALTIAPNLPGKFVVDDTEHDTTSVLSTIEHRFHVDALTSRDKAVPDLSSVWKAKVVAKK
jgi:acid phosphatase